MSTQTSAIFVGTLLITQF